MGGNAVGGDVPVGGGSTASTGPTSSAGAATATVHWAARCPAPGGTGTGHYWYVDIDAFHADGSHAGSVSAAEANVNSDSRTQSLLLQMAKGLKQETFSVQVTLNCPPNPVTPIGSHSAALALPKQGGGSGGD